ncbi:hypothetical protein M8494_32985 [Serratia ureilytica]
MSEKIGWIDNLRAIACMMVVMIHATTYYVTNGAAIGCTTGISPRTELACRACRCRCSSRFPGYLFFGERARPAAFHPYRLPHSVHSAIALICYRGLHQDRVTWPSLRGILQSRCSTCGFSTPLRWFTCCRRLISVKPVSRRYLAAALVVLAAIANPGIQALTFGNAHLLPVNLYIYGDTSTTCCMRWPGGRLA